MERGKSIVIEGNDGTGKSTLIRRMATRVLNDYGIESYIIDEPDGEDLVCQAIRDVIKNGSLPRVPKVNVLLFAASRAQSHLRGKEAVEAGKWLWKARDKSSTEVYQGIAEGVDLDDINMIMRFATDEEYMTPDLRVILSARHAVRKERIALRGETEKPDTFEMRGDSFQDLVAQGYDFIAARDKSPIVDAEQSQEEMEENMMELLWLRGLLPRR